MGMVNIRWAAISLGIGLGQCQSSRTATKSDRYITSVNSVSLKPHLKPLIIPYASNTINHPTELSPIYSPYEVFFIPNQSKSDPPTYSTIVITKASIILYTMYLWQRNWGSKKERKTPWGYTHSRFFKSPDPSPVSTGNSLHYWAYTPQHLHEFSSPQSFRSHWQHRRSPSRPQQFQSQAPNKFSAPKACNKSH